MQRNVRQRADAYHTVYSDNNGPFYGTKRDATFSLPYVSHNLHSEAGGSHSRAYFSNDGVPRLLVLYESKGSVFESARITFSLRGRVQCTWVSGAGSAVAQVETFQLDAETARLLMQEQVRDATALLEQEKTLHKRQRTRAYGRRHGGIISLPVVEAMLAVLAGDVVRKFGETAAAFKQLFRERLLIPVDYPFSIPAEIIPGCTRKVKCKGCGLNDVERRHKPLDQLRREILTWAESVGRLIHSTGRVFLARNDIFTRDLTDLRMILKMLRDDETVERLNQGVSPVFANALKGRIQHWGNIARFTAFGSVSFASRYSVGELRGLNALGLDRVVIGLETGSKRIREAAWGKDFTNDEAVAVVHNLHEAGIQADVVVVLGLGGRKGSEEHIAETQQLIARLPHSTVLFSPLDLAHANEELRASTGDVTKEDIVRELNAFGGIDAEVLHNARRALYDLETVLV